MDTIVTTNYTLTAYGYFNSSGISLYMIAYTDVSGVSMGNSFTIPTDTSGTYTTINLSSLELLESELFDLEVAPNPCTEMLSINASKNFQDYMIVNSLGQIVQSQQLIDTNTIDVRSLNSGIYHLVLSDGKNLSSKKFIKE
jgi:hypothetical protein